MATLPRVVVVTRPSEYEELLVRHGTREQARFFLQQRDQNIDEVQGRHVVMELILTKVSQAIPMRWRRVRIARADLARFVFEPDDYVVAVGQDGLVANVAKYLDGQPVIGVNPFPGRNPGVLVRHEIDAFESLLRGAAEHRAQIEARTMVEARLDDGQHLVALNEIFVGHRTHQSARYRIAYAGKSEQHSSSGLIVATGTGATGWARSIARDRAVTLPTPTARQLVFLVREAWPSPTTGTDLTDGPLDKSTPLQVTSQMNEDGVLFGDGIESDRLNFTWGQRATLTVAPRHLNLVVA